MQKQSGTRAAEKICNLFALIAHLITSIQRKTLASEQHRKKYNSNQISHSVSLMIPKIITQHPLQKTPFVHVVEECLKRMHSLEELLVIYKDLIGDKIRHFKRKKA